MPAAINTRLRLDHVIRPHLFAARIEDQIGKRFTKLPAGEARTLIVRLLDNRRNRRGRKRMP